MLRQPQMELMREIEMRTTSEEMMAWIYRIFLALNSLWLTYAVFLSNQKTSPCAVAFHLPIPDLATYGIYFLTAVFISLISLGLAGCLPTDSIGLGSLSAVEPANDTYLPSYLGYFFVALSTSDVPHFLFVFGIIYIFVLFSRAGHFNPVYFLFGYKYYYAIDKDNAKILIITKRAMKNAKQEAFDKMRRINDFTFIEI